MRGVRVGNVVLLATVAVASARPVVAEVPSIDEVIITAGRLGLRAAPDVGTRLGTPIMATPAAITVVPQERLQTQGRNTLIEAVRGVSGLIGAERPGAAGVFSYRGFAENNGGILFDGVRVQSSTITMRNYDSFNFERIEVLRGPAGALYGEGAGAGAINFVPRAPRGGAINAETLFQFGSHEQARFGAAASGTLVDPVDFVVSGVKANYGTFVEGTKHDNLHLVGGLAVRLSERTRATVGFDWLDNSVDDAYWGQPVINGRPVPSLRRVNYNRSPDNAYEDQVLWTRFGLEHAFSESITYSGRIWHYQADRTWRNFFGFEYVQPRTVVIRAVEDLKYDHEFYGTRQDLTVAGNLGSGIQGRLVLGVEAGRTDFSSPRSYAPAALRPVVDLHDPVPRPFAPLVPPREDARRAEIDNLSGFAEGLLEIGPHWSLSAGLNVLRSEADIARPSAGVAFEQNRDPVNVRFGAVYKPTPDDSIYLQYGTGGEPASDSVVILAPADASLKLTQVEQIEVGSKHSMAGGRVELTAAFFHIDKKDIASVSPTAPTELQVGSQVSRGFELAIAADATEGVRLEANAAFVDADLTVRDGPRLLSGVRPPNAPRWVLNGLVEIAASDRLLFGANATHVSARYGNNANSVLLDDYLLADLYARYVVTDRMDLTVRVKNVGDAVHATWATVGFGQVAAYFGAPRSFEATLRVRF